MTSEFTLPKTCSNNLLKKVQGYKRYIIFESEGLVLCRGNLFRCKGKTFILEQQPHWSIIKKCLNKEKPRTRGLH